MNAKVSVKTRVVINNKRYGSLDEMPPELRAACEKAMASGAASRPASRTISFNGREYDSPEAMPPDERRVYEVALAGLGQAAFPAAATRAPAPETDGGAIEPKALSRPTLWALVAGAGLLALWYFLRN